MTLSELRSIVDSQVVAQVLTLPASGNNLGSPAIDTLITTYFGGAIRATVIPAAGQSGVITQDVLTYRINLNTQSFLLYQKQALLTGQLLFYLRNDTVYCTAELELPSGYGFSDSFETLAKSPDLSINLVHLSDTVFKLDAEHPDVVGLQTSLLLSGPLKNIEPILPGNLNAEGTLRIIRQDDQVYPVIYLETPMLRTLSLGIFEFDLLIRMGTTFSVGHNGLTPLLNGVVELLTELRTPEVTIPVAMPMYGEEDSLHTFYLDIHKPKPALKGLSDLSSFYNHGNPGNLLNPEIQLGGVKLSLDQLSMTADLNAPAIESLEIGVTAGLNWSIIPRILELEQLRLLFSIYDPIHPKAENIQVLLGAQLKIGSVYLDASVLLPDKILQASLDDGSEIPLSDFINTLAHGVGLPGDGILSIRQLDLYAKVKDGQEAYSAHAAAYGQLAILNGLTLNSIVFFISYDLGKLNEVRLAAVLNLTNAKVDLLLQAQFADGNGWTFTGNSEEDALIPIGDIIKDIAHHFGTDESLPAFLQGLGVKNLNIAFNTLSKDFTFSCTVEFPVDGKNVDLSLAIELTHRDNYYSKKFSGSLHFGSLIFDVVFSQDTDAAYFLAAYQNPSGGELPIVALLQNVTDDADLLAVAENIHVELKDALFAYYKKDTAKFLFALDLGVGIDLSALPLVGKLFPPEQSLHLAFQPLIASQKFVQSSELSTLSTLVPAGGATLPARDIEAGFGLAASMRFGSTAVDMSLPVSMNSQGQLQHDTTANTGGSGTGNGQAAVPAASAGNIRWFDLQKKLGPVYFEKAGMRYENSEISFLLSASLALGPLSISLDGLGVTSALHPIEPHFSLNGLGIEYKTPAFEIGGAFLKNPNPPADVEREYDGAALIKTRALTLSALGSYAILKNGHPSLFLYAVLDYPIGGPAFFFVTGLAAGFGYNRGLIIPAVEQLTAFPLISDVVGGKAKAAGSAAELTGKLTALASYIPPQEGQYFLAVGIKFTSFKLIDSFALLTVSFGRHFEIDLLGLSTLVLPPAVAGSSIEPLAVVQMALKASFIPDEGFLGVEARLTSASYILSKNCHLTGGFAFYSWFDGPHKGDFALTLGGYHPSFKAPAHYPQAPRVGFNWQVDAKLSIKGEAFFALVPSAVMAGGRLSALWDSGSLKAWFIIGAEFLISWKPYHYDARLYLDMGVSYTYDIAGTQHTLKVELGADLHIWGPEFSGQARIHLFIITFDVTFGAGASQSPEPIDWKEFTTSFLPQASDVCSIAIQDGLVRKLGEDAADLGIVNPKELELIVNSVVPSKTAVSPNVASLPVAGLNTDFGIAPMGVDDLSSQQHVEITLGGQPVKDKFVFEAIAKEVPAGLWGKKVQPELNGRKVIGNALAGFRIRAARPQEPDVTQKIDRKNFAFQTDYLAGAYEWQEIRTFPGNGLSDQERRAHISNNIAGRATVDARERLLRALGLDDPVSVKPDLANAFILAPKVKAATA